MLAGFYGSTATLNSTQASARSAIPKFEKPRPARVPRRSAVVESGEFLFVFAAYLAAGILGLSVPFTSGNVSPLWPPAGIALAGTLLFGYRVWPAIALAAFVVNVSDIPHSAAAGIAVGNTVGPLCGAWLLRQRRYFEWSLTRLRDVLALVIFGVAGTAVSATIGALALFLADVNAWSGLASSWLIWWLGDSMGVLIVTPVVLTAPRLVALGGTRRLAELACLLVGAVGSALMVFDPRLGVIRAEAFGFAVFPFVLWGAIRFESGGASSVCFLISSIAVWGTAHGFGPFVSGNVLQNAMLLESFLGVTSLSGLLLAASVAEHGQLIREQSAREALARSAKSYRDIVETAYEGIWKIDGRFITSSVNRRMADLLGYTVGEMLGRPLFDFMFDSDVEEKRVELRHPREGVTEQLEARFRRRDGSTLWASVATSPMRGEDGTFEGALVMVSDMTESKRAADEAFRSRERINLLSRAVEQTADSVVITDRGGTIQYVNSAFEATTGYTRDEAIGRTPRILKSAVHDREFYTRLWEQLLQGETFHGTLVNRKKCGELYRTEQTITPIKDSAGSITHFVSVLKDITEIYKQRERALQLQMARGVQQRFYASTPICVDRFEVATVAQPAEETGGDYLDLLAVGDRRLCVGIGDVSGHGLDSALVMALTRAYVRAFAQVESDVATILGSVNRMLIADLDENRFVTLLLVCLDPATAEMSYAGAGHIPGFLVNASGKVERVLESSGPPLGLFPDAQYETTSIELASQQLVILLTDGITECASSEGEEFGTQGVLDYVSAHAGESTQELAAGILGGARSVAGEAIQQDDMTEVIIRIH